MDSIKGLIKKYQVEKYEKKVSSRKIWKKTEVI